MTIFEKIKDMNAAELAIFLESEFDMEYIRDFFCRSCELRDYDRCFTRCPVGNSDIIQYWLESVYVEDKRLWYV